MERPALVRQIGIGSSLLASLISRKRHSSSALSTNLPAVSVIGRISAVLDSNAWTVISATVLAWLRSCISASDTVEPQPDQTLHPAPVQ